MRNENDLFDYSDGAEEPESALEKIMSQALLMYFV